MSLTQNIGTTDNPHFYADMGELIANSGHEGFAANLLQLVDKWVPIHLVDLSEWTLDDTRDSVLDTCWQHLRPGGRLVANAVTLQSEMTLMDWRARYGGELTRIHVAQAQPLGAFDTWRQALPITLLEVVKPR